MVIDNYESQYLSDNEIVKAIKELSKKSEYVEVSKWVSLLGKDGQIKDIVRNK